MRRLHAGGGLSSFHALPRFAPVSTSYAAFKVLPSDPKRRARGWDVKASEKYLGATAIDKNS